MVWVTADDGGGGGLVLTGGNWSLIDDGVKVLGADGSE